MNEKEQKKCTTCGEIKSFNYFCKAKDCKYGFSSKCKKCHCAYQKLRRGNGIDFHLLTDKQKKLKKQHAEGQKRLKRRNPNKTMLIAAKSRAKRKNLEFNITEDDIYIPETCPALGIIIKRSDKINSGDAISLDRLDSTKGYTKDNINIISMRANGIKSDATFEEFEAIYKWWKSELKKRKKKPCPNTTSE